MEPQRWRLLTDLVLEALAKPEDERSGFLEQACEDPGLRREVASILASDRELGEDLERPPLRLVETGVGWQPGDEIGPYRLLREIGRGGMGVVFLAERADREFRRRVALKVLKRGLDTAEIVRRFRNERQILANLSHPAIAELYDGGTTGDGLPYLVMEHVEGLPIDLYCTRLGLSLDDRLELFLSVCEPVQLAHRNLIVHRDLKPANILITGDGQPKLLDFGIAKLLDPADPGHGATTAAGLRPMTPDYASPEQLRGEPVTTGTDVYALGLILFELLTGRRPPRPQASAGADPDRPPPRPSASVTGEAAPGAPPVEPSRLRRLLAGDLDNIVSTALTPDASKRYPSVERFAGDVRRYLAGLPVSARRPTLAYRAGKYLRRNRRAIAAAALAALVGGGALVDRERQQRATARERDRAEQVTEFLAGLFEVSDPRRQAGGEVTARELLEQGARRLGTELSDQPLARASLLAIIGRVFLDLGPPERGERYLRQALEIQEDLLGGDHPQTRGTVAALARARFLAGDYDAALELCDRVLDAEPRTRAERLTAATVLELLGEVQTNRRDFEAAEAPLQSALEIRRELLGNRSAEVAEALNGLGLLYHHRGDLDVAERYYLEALEIRRAVFGPEHPEVAANLNDLGGISQVRGDFETAEERYGQALALLRRFFGEDHALVALAVNNLGTIYQEHEDFDRAESYLRRALEIRRRVFGADHQEVAASLNNLGVLMRIQGRLDAAEPFLRDALAMRRRLDGARHPEVGISLFNLARLLTRKGQLEDADETMLEALDILRDSGGPPPEMILLMEGRRGEILVGQGRYAAAEELYTRILGELEASPDAPEDGIDWVRQRLVELHLVRERPADAETQRELVAAR